MSKILTWTGILLERKLLVMITKKNSCFIYTLSFMEVPVFVFFFNMCILLSPWSRVLFGKLIVPQPPKKSPAINGTWRFVTVVFLSLPPSANSSVLWSRHKNMWWPHLMSQSVWHLLKCLEVRRVVCIVMLNLLGTGLMKLMLDYFSPSDCALFKDALWFSIHDFNVRASHMSMGAGNNDDEFECVYYFK